MKRNFTILYDSSARETPIKKKTKASIISSRSVDGKMQNVKKKKKSFVARQRISFSFIKTWKYSRGTNRTTFTNWNNFINSG